MASLLLEIKEAVEKTQEEQLSTLKIEAFENRYDEIVTEGFDANPRSPPKSQEASSKKRGQKSTPIY